MINTIKRLLKIFMITSAFFFINNFVFCQTSSQNDLIAENAFKSYISITSYSLVLICVILIFFSFILNLLKPYIIRNVKKIKIISNANSYWTVYIFVRDLPLFIFLAVGLFTFVPKYQIGDKSYFGTFLISYIIVIIILGLKNVFDVDENPIFFWIATGLMFVGVILTSISYIQIFTNIG